MKYLKGALIAVIVAAVPALGQAWSGYNGVTIATSTAHQAGKASPPGVLIILTRKPSDSEDCMNSNQGYVWIDFSSTGLPDGRTLYAVVLTALSAGKAIDIGANGCATNGFPMAYAIAVEN